MTDKDIDSLSRMLKVVEEAGKLKDQGANNTQVRAYMEDNGFKKVEFINDDVGKNPGLKPSPLPTPGDLTSGSFDLPIIRQRFAPKFDADLANRHLYKTLIKRMNDEINEGPMKGYFFILGIRRVNKSDPIEGVIFQFGVKTYINKHGRQQPSFRSVNRTRVYSEYILAMRKKYAQEIIEAEAKVMERE